MSAKGLSLAAPRPAAATIGKELSAMAGELAAMVRRAKGEETFLAEFNLYALSDPELRKAVGATYAGEPVEVVVAGGLVDNVHAGAMGCSLLGSDICASCSRSTPSTATADGPTARLIFEHPTTTHM